MDGASCALRVVMHASEYQNMKTDTTTLKTKRDMLAGAVRELRNAPMFLKPGYAEQIFIILLDLADELIELKDRLEALERKQP